MKIIIMKCPNCGGNLDIDEEKGIAHCSYCSSDFLLEDIRPSKEQEPPPVTAPPASAPSNTQVRGKSSRLPGVFLCVIILIFSANSFIKISERNRQNTSYDLSDGYSSEGTSDDNAMSEADSSPYEPSEDMQIVLERMFHKSQDSITQEDYDQVRYLKVTCDSQIESNTSFVDAISVYYSFDDYYAAADQKAYLESLPCITLYRDGMQGTLYSSDFDCFTNLTYISCDYLDKDTLKKMKQLKGIDGFSGNLEDIKDAVDPSGLIELHISGRYTLDDEDLAENISSFSNLQTLALCHSELTSIEPLSACQSLTSLDLSYNDSVTDYYAVKKLPQLQQLSINAGQLKDIGFVTQLPALTQLTIKNSRISSIDCLQDAPHLIRLDLDGNDALNDYSPVGALTDLEALALNFSYAQKVNDLSFIGQLSSLKTLSIECLSEDVSSRFFGRLQNLEHLSLNDVSFDGSLASLAGCHALQSLKLCDMPNAWSNFGQLAAHGSLKTLDLSEEHLSKDAASLFKLTSLETLNLAKASIRTSSWDLQQLSHLKELNLSHVTIQKLAAAGDGSSYEDMTPDEMCQAVSQCISLEKLDISGDEISSLDFASSLANLKSINFVNNSVTDVTPLAACPQLEAAIGKLNPIEDWSPLAAIPYEK